MSSIKNFTLKLSLTLIILSTSFYTAKIFISPIYIISSIGIILYIAYITMLGRIRYTSSTLLAIILLLYTSLVSFIFPNGALFNLILGLLSYIIITSINNYNSTKFILKLAHKSVWIILILISCDTAWRLMHPTIPDAATLSAYEDRNTIFYLYKTGSLMFSDSNTTALLIMQYIFLARYLKEFHKITSFYKTHQAIMILLIALSFSRASILTTILLFVIDFMDKHLTRAAKIISFSTLIIIGVFTLNLLSEKDASFQSKFDILNKVEGHLLSEQSLMSKAIGIGLDQSLSVIGVAAHNIFLTYALELGFIGFLIFFIFLVSAYLDARKTLKYCIAPAIISGLSYYFYAGAPFFFVPLGIIVFLESRRIASHAKNSTHPASI